MVCAPCLVLPLAAVSGGSSFFAKNESVVFGSIIVTVILILIYVYYKFIKTCKTCLY